MQTMHLLPSVAIQPSLELKTRPKQLLGSLPLVIALPGCTLLCVWGGGVTPVLRTGMSLKSESIILIISRRLHQSENP